MRRVSVARMLILHSCLSIELCAETKEERNPLIVLRNGKVTLKQRLYSLEKMSETMQGASFVANCESS